jgi:hypothetical protein
MSKITKRIKTRQEEMRKKKSSKSDSIIRTETVSEDVNVSNVDQSKDSLKKLFVNLKTSMRQSVGGYGKQSVTPISVSPSLSIPETLTQEQPKQEVAPVKSKTKTLIKNVKSILKDRIGETSVGQFAYLTKDLTTQFKDLFKTQEEIFAEQVIEEAKTKKKETERKEKEDKLREEILKREGLLVEKKEKQQKETKKTPRESKTNDTSVLNVQVADDIQKIRTLMEMQSQQSAHSMEDAAEQANQQAEVVKTLKGIEKNLQTKPSVVKDVKKEDGLLSMIPGLMDFGSIISKVGPALTGLGTMFASLSAAILPVSAILGVVAAGLWGFNKWIDSAAEKNRGTEQWKAQATPEELQKWKEEEAVYNKALEESNVRKVKQAEVEKVHKWDATNAALEKTGSDRRLVDGKSVSNWKKNDDGTYSILDVEKAAEIKPTQPQSLNDQMLEGSEKLAQLRGEKARVTSESVELQPKTDSMATKLTETMTDSYNQAQLEKQTKQEEQKPIVIQQTIPVPDTSGQPIALFDTRRNSDNTFQRLNDRMFTGSFI